MDRHFTFLSLLLFTITSSARSQALITPPKNGDVYVIAHRGAHIGIPENSLAAYQKAIDLGCDFVEIDVRTTKDNHFVSVHNSSIDAYVEGKTGEVKNLTLAELKVLDIGKRIGDEWIDTRIPTFEQILKLCQGKIGIYLDLKDADPSELIEIIKKYNMETTIVWYIPAFYNKAIMEVKSFCPDCLVMPDPGKEKNIEKVSTAYQPKVIASDIGALSQSFVKKVHEKGALVFVDDSEDLMDKLHDEWQTLFDWGVDGIQTDQPEALIKYLQSMK